MTKRWILVAGAAILAGQGAGAAAAPTLEECRAIGDVQKRLACYDEIPSTPAPAAPAPVAVAPASAAAAVSVRQATTEETFGLSAAAQRAEPEEVTSKIVSISGNRSRPLVVLDNGHEWQVTTDRNLADRLRPGQTVTIKRGMMSGYRIYADGVTGMESVRRIR